MEQTVTSCSKEGKRAMTMNSEQRTPSPIQKKIRKDGNINTDDIQNKMKKSDLNDAATNQNANDKPKKTLMFEVPSWNST